MEAALLSIWIGEISKNEKKRLKYNGNAMGELKKRIGLKFLKSGAGFTLIELLIVVAVLGILAAGIIIVMNPADQIRKAKDAQRKSDLFQIKNALETYYNDFGQYPASSDTDPSLPYRIKADENTILNWGSTGWQYIGTLPKDPSSSKYYVYYSPLDRQSYYLYASLDRGEVDAQACDRGYRCTNVPLFASCGTNAECNYGISSPNVSP